MNEAREIRALGRVVRLDLVIAICALLISSLATIASFWQTIVVQKQLSAAVLPYLEVTGMLSADEVKFSIDNVGVGPAIIKDAVLTDHGVAKLTVDAAFRPRFDLLKRGTTLSTSTSDINPGVAIRAGDSLVVLDARAKGVREVVLPLLASGDLKLCYCSILDQCWTVSEKVAAPVPAPSCDEHDPNRLQQLDFHAKFRDAN
jgi:hypothetical protein